MNSPPGSQDALEISCSRQFISWLESSGASLAFTTYQAGKLFLLGVNSASRLSVFERTFNRCMGLCGDAQTLYMSTLYQVWRLENSLAPDEAHEGYDRLYVPRCAYTTGDLDIHDMALDAHGRLVFVNTLFSCLATVSETHSFAPLWRPRFISKLAAEDRCHLNGLAMQDGKPRYVTCVSRSDAADGWRERRRDGGLLIDVPSGEAVLTGLSMPHSPRLHGGRLWMLNSGEGEFGYLDPTRPGFVALTFCPGYLRGLCFVGNCAVVGISRPRHQHTFAGLNLEEKLRARNVEARCGLLVIDLKSGDIVHWVRLDGIVDELYDVVALAGARRPMALGFKTDEIRRFLSVEPQATMGENGTARKKAPARGPAH